MEKLYITLEEHPNACWEAVVVLSQSGSSIRVHSHTPADAILDVLSFLELDNLKSHMAVLKARGEQYQGLQEEHESLLKMITKCRAILNGYRGSDEQTKKEIILKLEQQFEYLPPATA